MHTTKIVLIFALFFTVNAILMIIVAQQQLQQRLLFQSARTSDTDKIFRRYSVTTLNLHHIVVDG